MATIESRERNPSMSNSLPTQDSLHISNPLRFGDFVLDTSRYELRKGDTLIRLQPKTFEVLRFFVCNSGRLIEKDELFRAVWPGVIVTENSLTRCIKDLRKALGDDATHPRYIETIARKGYRFAVTPQAVADNDELSPNASTQADFVATAVHHSAPQTRPPAHGQARSVQRAFLIVTAVGIIAAVAIMIFRREAEPIQSTPVPAIAVLPFANLSSEPETQFFADGVAEDLLDLFAHIPNLRVAARTSSFAFRAVERDVKVIGRELGVDWVLEGSVRREADNIRVTVQLISTHSGYHAWSGRYDRKYTDLFAVQDEISRAVVAQVVPRVEPASSPPSAMASTNFDAHLSFMIGRDQLNRRPIGWHAKALAAFDRAIEIDPKFARAHAGKAIVEALGSLRVAAPVAGMQRAKLAADRATQLDPTLALGHAARGLILLNEDVDLRAAEDALRHALKLDPTLSNAYNWLNIVLRLQGQHAEALRQLEKGLEVDPLNPALLGNRGANLQAMGRPDEALIVYRRLLQLPERVAAAHISLSGLHYSRGELTEALRHSRMIERDTASTGGADKNLAAAPVYARLGMIEEADRRLRASMAEPFAVRWLSRFEMTLRTLGRLNELEPLAQRFGVAEPLAPWVEKYLGRSAVLRGDWDRGIARLAPFYRQAPRDGLGGWGDDLVEIDSRLALIHALKEKGRSDEAASSLAQVLEGHRKGKSQGLTQTPEELYLYAMTLALVIPPRDDDVFASLDQALTRGWSEHRLAENDPRWRRLKSDPRFATAMAKAAESVARERAKVNALIASKDAAFVDSR